MIFCYGVFWYQVSTDFDTTYSCVYDRMWSTKQGIKEHGLK